MNSILDASQLHFFLTWRECYVRGSICTKKSSILMQVDKSNQAFDAFPRFLVL